MSKRKVSPRDRHQKAASCVPDLKTISQSLIITNPKQEQLKLNIKKKKKFSKKIYSGKGYRFSGALEYEDAIDFIRRNKYPKLQFDFPKPKKTSGKKKTKSPTPSFKKKAMDYDEVMVIARRRRVRRRKQRITRLKILHSETKPPEDIISPIFPKSLCGGFYKVGVSEMKGKRPTMEDHNCVLVEKTKCILGVFDGHCGKSASNYVAKNFIHKLKTKLIKKEVLHLEVPEEATQGKKRKELRKYILRDTFLELHEEIKEKNKYGGTCATAIFIRKHRCFVANVGDSKAVLYKKNGKMLNLTEDHNTKNEKERERIKKMGGRITGSRINGLLNVTRALGDCFSNLLSRDPYTVSFKLNPEDDHYIIMASDGLWNYVTPKEAYELIKNNDDPRVAAMILRNKAFERRGTDNITVVCIYFTEVVTPRKENLFKRVRKLSQSTPFVTEQMKLDKNSRTRSEISVVEMTMEKEEGKKNAKPPRTPISLEGREPKWKKRLEKKRNSKKFDPSSGEPEIQ